jgi:hypothetical protein
LFLTGLIVVDTHAAPAEKCEPERAHDPPVRLVSHRRAVCRILACAYRHPTGIILEKDAVYRFEASGRWHDANIECGPEEYALSSRPIPQRWVLAAGCPLLRVRGAPYFELIGEVPAGSKRHVRIGAKRANWLCPASGELAAFANDVPFVYSNNSGSIELIVYRVR